MNNSQELAIVIKATARDKKITLKQMLADCGLSVNALSSMQSGGYYPRVEALARIADYLDCSVDYLLGRAAAPAPVSNEPSDCQGQSAKNSYNVVIQDFLRIVKGNPQKILIT